MAQNFHIGIDLSGLAQVGALARAGMLQHLARAVATTAEAGRERWQAAILAAPLWDAERREYAATIVTQQIGPLSWTIMSDYKYAEDIESGRPARDLKQMLNTSTKVRRTKDGRRFLIVPFRQNTPGHNAHSSAMPAAVYKMAKGLASSSIVSQGHRPAGEVTHLSRGGMSPAAHQTPFMSDHKTKTAFMVAKRNYAWGGKVTRRMLQVAGASPADQKRHANTYRFKEATGGSTYMTFRMMIEGSQGWIVPAKPGLWLAKNVADSLGRTADLDFAAAAKLDFS